jgi:hypothetical protein
MSRHPLFLYPSQAESNSNEFEVRSNEWSSDGTFRVLGRIVRDSSIDSCTFAPSELWLAEGFFPNQSWSVTLESLSQFLAGSQANPSSLYTHRLAQAMERLLVGLPANPSLQPTTFGRG